MVNWMARKKAQFDAVATLNEIESKFEMVQVLDEEGNVVNNDYRTYRRRTSWINGRMVWTRVLERSISLNRQGRLGFYAPTAGQKLLN